MTNGNPFHPTPVAARHRAWMILAVSHCLRVFRWGWRSLSAVLKNNPDLAEKLRRSRPTTFGLGPVLEAYNKDFRRGKFV